MKKQTVLMGTLLLVISAYAQKPNVLFLAVDDVNDWVGCMDSRPNAVTPNIDRLAAMGVNFSNAHTAGTYCAPSRAAIFTGQYASTTGIYKYQCYQAVHPEFVPLQCAFHEAGYETYGAGKLYHHMDGYIDTRGWTEFFLRSQRQRENGWPLDSWGEDMPLPDQGTQTKENRGAYNKRGQRKWGVLKNKQEGEMADTIRTEWIVSKLKEKHDKPFFIGLGLYSPHIPNYCPQKYYDLYDRDKLAMPAKMEGDLDDLPEPKRSQMKKQAIMFKKFYEDTGLLPEAVHSYLACMSYTDAMIGRVLKALEASPYADNTIIVLWSDNGFHYGEKGHFGKKELWQRSTNIPFVWAGPGVAKGKKTDVTVSLIDMYPTFVELCGLPVPPQKLEGVSLATTLKDPASAKDRDVYVPQIEPNGYAIINRKWRYIKYADDTEELYNVQKDHNEWENLAENPEYTGIKKALRAAAPETFAKPAPNTPKKNLIIDGDSYHWKMD